MSKLENVNSIAFQELLQTKTQLIHMYICVHIDAYNRLLWNKNANYIQRKCVYDAINQDRTCICVILIAVGPKRGT